MNTLRRPLLSFSLAALAALGCGPAVSALQGEGPGVNSTSLLTAKTPAMAIEVIPTTDHQPSQDALALVAQRANERCYKPGGITVQVDDVVPVAPHAGVHLWTVQELLTFEAANAKLSSTPQQAVLQICYVDGHYAQNAAAIALSYTGHSIAIFTDMLGPNGPEGPALVHELGHQLGLVNGTTREIVAHEDVPHGLHDTSTGCVMFFSLNPTQDSGTVSDYCQNCKDDLKRAGGK